MNNIIPADYQYINMYDGGISPSSVHTRNNAAFAYYQRYLLQKAFSVFKWKMPSDWNMSYFLYTLYCSGTVAVFNCPEYGTVPQYCTLTGYNIYHAPVTATMTPLGATRSYTRTINKDCVLFKMSADYMGILDLINTYADRLALCSQSVDINLLNSHLAYICFADNKAQAESFKKLLDKVLSGEPAVVTGKENSVNGKPNWDTFSQNLSQNYIASDILFDMKKIENDFATQIGLPNANTDKKERMITDEVNANNVETQSLSALWLEDFKKSAIDVKRMFGVDITVDWRFKTEVGEEIG